MNDRAWPVAFEPPRGEIDLGGRSYPVRHRALVMAVMTGTEVLEAESLVADGAAVLQLPPLDGWRGLSDEEETRFMVASVGALLPLGVPVAVDTTRVEVLRAALDAGAAVVCAPAGGSGSAHLAAAAAAGAAVVVSPQRLADAQSAGIPVGRVVVATGLDAEAPGPDCSRLVSADDEATWSLAIALGFRVLRTSQVRQARRVADVMAAVLEARRS